MTILQFCNAAILQCLISASFRRSSSCGSGRRCARSRRGSAPTRPSTRCARRRPTSRAAIAGGDAALSTEAGRRAHRSGGRDTARPTRSGRRSQPVINATGVIIHTNLGRAPLAAAAIERVAEVARGYSSLEYDLARGARGRRDVHAEALLCRLTGAEAAVVVNNNAAATMLVLAALAAGREVIVSRGELVEIGGGFRVPDVMAQSGAILREVGTTNKTRAADYAAAISERTALILRVHPSNFRIEGFTERPSLADLVALGKKIQHPGRRGSRQRPPGWRSGAASRVRPGSDPGLTLLAPNPRSATRFAAGRRRLLLQRRQAPRRTAGRASSSAARRWSTASARIR